jgi:hypothetical protein
MAIRLIRDPFDFILPRQKEADYADSTVIGLVGPKRSDKTLVYSKLLYRDMCYGRPVWSNIPVKTPQFFLDKGYPDLHTKQIDWNAFFSMSEEYQYGTMGLDEASAINPNRSPLSSKNRVTNAFTNQIGHRSVDVIWTAKSIAWLDRQGLGFETDIEIFCHDMAKTTWGHQHHIKKGTIAYLEAYDRSGALTGRIADRRDKYARPFKRWYLNECDRYWTAYDTRGLQTVEEIFGGVELDLQKRVISNKVKPEEYEEPLYRLAEKMSTTGKLISCDSFWENAEDMDIPGDRRQLGKVLRGMNIKRKQKAAGYFYDLSDLRAPG